MGQLGYQRALVNGMIVTATVMLGVVALARGQSDGPGTRPMLAARQFDSKLSLRVRAQTGESTWQDVGETPSKEPLKIPTCIFWLVEPLEDISLHDLVSEVRHSPSPGSTSMRLSPTRTWRS